MERERFTAEERQAKSVVDKAKRRIRKANKAERRPKIVPARSTSPDNALRERRPRQKDKAYLQWIKRLPCIATARRHGQIVFGCDAAHVRSSYPEPGWPHTGRGEKPDDVRTTPLTRALHEEQHGMNERDWWSALDLYPPAVCARLRAAYEAQEPGELVILEIARWPAGVRT